MNMLRVLLLAVLAAKGFFDASAALAETGAVEGAQKPPIRIGWVGAMTGPVAKYASWESATLAMEDINREGGLNGRPLQILFQDGKCQAKDAIDAVNALIEKEKLHFIVGGHCSTESLAIAPVVERHGVIMIAASSSSPKLTTAGDHIFRVTAPNIKGVELLVPHILSERKERSVAVVYEETEYAQGLGEYFQKLFVEKGGKIPVSLAYKLGDADFLSFVTRVKASGADGLYLSVQSPDSAILFLSKAKQLGLNLPIFGNEITGNSVSSASAEQIPLFEALLFAEPALADKAALEEFTARYRARFHVEKLPNGFWSLEAYDATRVLADNIKRCGEEPEAVKGCLYQMKDYMGASGPIAFDSNGDGVRKYALKVVTNGRIEEFSR